LDNNPAKVNKSTKRTHWLGKSFVPLIKKDELPKIIEVFHKTSSGEPQQYEVTVKKVDGNNLILS